MNLKFSPSPYRTLSEASNFLMEQGYRNNFKLLGEKLLCVETDNKYDPDDLSIIEYHRFEGESNPSDMSIIFAIKCNDGTKGSIISSFGTYSDEKLDKFMEQVKIADRSEAAGPIQ